MLLQRMIKDDEVGFNYDYMGYAEFEFGATTASRKFFAQCVIDETLAARRCEIVMTYGRSESVPIKVVAIGKRSVLENEVMSFNRIVCEKTSSRYESKRIVGWMEVRADAPILFIRDEISDWWKRFELYIGSWLGIVGQNSAGDSVLEIIEGDSDPTCPTFKCEPDAIEQLELLAYNKSTHVAWKTIGELPVLCRYVDNSPYPGEYRWTIGGMSKTISEVRRHMIASGLELNPPK